MKINKNCFEIISAEMSTEDVQQLFVDRLIDGCVSTFTIDVLGSKIKIDLKVTNPLIVKKETK